MMLPASEVVFYDDDYPGWRATVYCENVSVGRANSTFMAAQPDARTSTVPIRWEWSAVANGPAVSLRFLLLVLPALSPTFVGRRTR